MTTTQKSGRDVAADPRARREQLHSLQHGERGLDRGVLSAAPLEDFVVGKDLFLAAVDVGHLPFICAALAVQARDDAGGVLSVALFRVGRDDVSPAGWKGIRSGFANVNVAAAPSELCSALGVDREIDRTAAAWFVGVRGSTDTMTVRGTSSYTSPSFAGWSMSGIAALPQTIQSDDLTWTRCVPSVAMLSRAGVRLRGTGTIPT